MKPEPSEYWNAYFFHLDRAMPLEGLHSEVQILRFKNILGMTAIENTMTQFWKHFVLSEWDEVKNFVQLLLSNPKDIDHLVQRTGGVWKRSHWVATFRFLENTGDPERFSPSLGDVVAWLVCRHHDTVNFELVRDLLELQQIRNQIFHSGAELNKQQALRGLQIISRFAREAGGLHPALSDFIPTENKIEILKVA